MTNTTLHDFIYRALALYEEGDYKNHAKARIAALHEFQACGVCLRTAPLPSSNQSPYCEDHDTLTPTDSDLKLYRKWVQLQPAKKRLRSKEAFGKDQRRCVCCCATAEYTTNKSPVCTQCAERRNEHKKARTIHLEYMDMEKDKKSTTSDTVTSNSEQGILEELPPLEDLQHRVGKLEHGFRILEKLMSDHQHTLQITTAQE